MYLLYTYKKVLIKVFLSLNDEINNFILAPSQDKIVDIFSVNPVSYKISTKATK